mmetsp:Transcript_26433/g.19818  ORF Transcript_26433/g.19818 Transcript_26433/m.19818 type:complete len:118 (+) Transcript_26433:335-688(+)
MPKVASADVKVRSSKMTTLFNSYTTNNHFVGTEQLVWIVGFDDRKNGNSEKQLMGHTKSYTKVVLDSASCSILEHSPEALIGRCIKIKVVEACKWHITGDIIDASVQTEYLEELVHK